MRNKTFFHQPMKRSWATIAMALLAIVAGLPPASGTATAAGGFAHLIKDINTTSLSSEPHAMVTVGNLVYFITRDGQERASLWKSDGTAGTARITDNVQRLHAMNGMLFFSSRQDELWRTDGTVAGTLLLAEGIYAGCCSAFLEARLFANIDRMSFFIAQDPSGSQALWRSDGTAAGTMRIKQISRIISDLIRVGRTMFFIVAVFSSVGYTYELWKSDGTADGTIRVKQLPAQLTATGRVEAGPISPSIGDIDIVFADLEQVDGTLFFAINGDPVPGEYGLWKSDGTAAGTVPVKKIVARDLTSINGMLFFVSVLGPSGSNATELWKSDGSEVGTSRVTTGVNPDSNFSAPYLVDVDGTIFLNANADMLGAELHKSDGTTSGTVLVKDINPGLGSSNPRDLVNMNGTVFFSADDHIHGRELWRSDGTAAGTMLVKDISSGAAGSWPGSIVAHNGRLFFSADDGAHGFELWVSDGTAAGTHMVVDIDTRTADSRAQEFTDVNGTLFFTSTDGAHAFELWKSDGTPEGTVLVKDVNPGSQGSGFGSLDYGPVSLTILDGKVFFISYNDGFLNGVGLWRSDGTAAGTLRLGNVSSVGERQLVNAGGTLFFTGIDAFGAELWKSDGTVAGTMRVADIKPGPYGSDLEALTNLNGTLLFSARDGSFYNSPALWKSDGTTAGTVLVKRIRAGTASWNAGEAAVVNGQLFFPASDDIHGIELWRSDGTTAGTVLVKDINPDNNGSGDPGSNPISLTAINGKLFFVAGCRLWKSDGTAAGTIQVKPNLKVVGYAYPGSSWLTDVDGTLFFVADDGTHGSELWRSDGSTAGTTLVKDLLPGSGSPKIADLTNVNGTLLFTALDDTGGRALWRSDGTAVGTRPLQQVAPPNSDFASTSIALSGDSLFFTADDGATGHELWVIPTVAGVGAALTLPTPATAPAGGSAAIPISYLNRGRTSARAITLTATLDPRLEYIDDTSGVAPTVSGAKVTWRLPSAGFLDGRDFYLRVRLPNAPLGTRLPLTLWMVVAGPDGQTNEDSVQTEVMVANIYYLPLAR
jgi:ELWxxDGT repeat protein